jgi:hypothetical protein
MRLVATAVAAATVPALFLLARRQTRSLTLSSLAALFLATAGASPYLEAFTLSGELLGALLVVCSLLLLPRDTLSQGGGRRLLAALGAGVLAGCALMVKQSALDALLAGGVFLLLRERRLLLPFLAAAGAPVAAAAASAASFHDWWFAVVGYRGEGDSLLTGSLVHRLGLLADSLPAAARGLGLLAILAAIGWRRSPLLARLWLAAALLGVLGGGNFHPHYYVQLAPPLALLGAIGAVRLRGRPALAAAAAVGVAASVALAIPLWWASPAAQARELFPQDPHLRTDAAVARWVRAHLPPGRPIMVLWADASLVYLAERPPAFRYLWYRPVQSIPGALDEARRVLAEGRPALVLAVQRPSALDRSGRTDRLLRERYERLRVLHSVTIYRRR